MRRALLIVVPFAFLAAAACGFGFGDDQGNPDPGPGYWGWMCDDGSAVPADGGACPPSESGPDGGEGDGG